jgi:hypothetical protein
MRRFVAVFFIPFIVLLGSRAALARPPEVDQLAVLYKELLRFKSDPKFGEVGFGLCCKYNAWMKRVEKLRDKPARDVWLQLGVLPGDLLTLGLEYAHSKGAETKFTRDRVPVFEAALFPAVAKKGFTGTVSDTDRYCRDIAIYQRQMELMLAHDYARASEIISNDATCPRVQQNTPVRGPLDRKKQGETTYVQVDAQGIGTIWMMEDAVEFKGAK